MSIYELQANVHILVIPVILLFAFPKKKNQFGQEFFPWGFKEFKTFLTENKPRANERGPT